MGSWGRVSDMCSEGGCPTPLLEENNFKSKPNTLTTTTALTMVSAVRVLSHPTAVVSAVRGCWEWVVGAESHV